MIIMMKKYTDQKEDEKLSHMISSTKMRAPENLKYRIMHQIEYEDALSHQKSSSPKSSKKESENVLRELGSIFGTMYAVITLMTIASYFIQGPEFYQSIEYWGAIILVGIIFSFFWLFSRIDTHLKSRRERNTLNNLLSKTDKRK